MPFCEHDFNEIILLSSDFNYKLHFWRNMRAQQHGRVPGALDVGRLCLPAVEPSPASADLV